MNSDQLVAQVRARFDYQAKKRLLKEKYQARMLFAHNSGMFRATPEMISFLSLYLDQEIVVLDLYENPIKIIASELCDAMKSRWQEQMNAWLVEYQQLQT